MKSQELIKIIRACKLAGVEHFKNGELELKFRAGDTAELGLGLEKTKPPTVEELKAVELSVNSDAQQDRIDEILATLAIEDPVAFEDGVIQGELKFSGSSQSE